uniref:RRM domain-containing protein n=1 Tax=Amphiprion percula TaxID=161767 RepID=A0A3P8S281_AMPPE
ISSSAGAVSWCRQSGYKQKVFSPLTSSTGPSKRIDGDNRSVCVGNVDYGATADEFSGHPSGFAYIEFSDRDSVHCAIGLHETLFRGRVLKVMPKRTNMPRISTTDRGGHRGGHSRGRGRGYCPPQYHNSSRGRFRFWQEFCHMGAVLASHALMYSGCL